MKFRQLSTPLGQMIAAANDEGLCLLEFSDRKILPLQISRVASIFGETPIAGEHSSLDITEGQLSEYFAGERNCFTMPLAIRGSAFQLTVWNRLLKIPAGETISYGQIANELAFENGQRAVGRANGDNRIAIIIPCHRVIRADGTLCGYGGGLNRKKWLLEHEQANWPRRHSNYSGQLTLQT